MKDGCRTVTTEFEVRELDRRGDALDVQHYETKQEAITEANRLMQRGAVAVVVERHTSRAPSCYWKTPDTYQRIAIMGGSNALVQGGWA
jgi:hypothetical protein